MSSLSSPAVAQLAKSSQRSALIGSLGLAMVFAALIYSAVHLASLKTQIDASNAELAAKRSEIAKLDTTITEKQLQVKVLNQVVTNLGSTNSQATGQAYRSALETNQGAADVLPRVYFQLRTKEQLPRAKQVADALIADGFSIPEFEIMYPHGTVRTFLRHFQNAVIVDQDRARIMTILKKLNVQVEEQDFSGKEGKEAGQLHRNYELWFGPDF